MNRRINFLTSISLVFALLGCGNLYECGHFQNYLNHEVYGTVTDKYLDSVNHMWPTIVYQTIDGQRGLDNETASYIRAVYDSIEVGDIIDKASGSTMVTVTKRGHIIKLDTAKETRSIWCQK